VTARGSARLAVAVAALAIAADIGLARVGYGLVLPAIRRELGGNYAAYGAIAAVHLGGYLAWTLAAPSVLRNRALRPRVTAIAHAFVALFVLASALSPTLLLLALTRLGIGLASGIGIASAVTDALERVPPERRGFASGLAWSAIGVALVVSAPAGAWTLDAAVRWRAATALWAIPALLVAVLAARIPAQRDTAPATATQTPFRWRDLARASNAYFVAAYAMYGVAYIAFVTFAVAAFAARGFAPPLVTLIWACCGAAAVVGSLAVGVVLGSAAHRWSLAIPMLCGGVGSVLAGAAGAFTATAGTVCVGLGLAATPAVASAFARERSDPASAARAFAGVTTVFGVGQLAGPMIAGAVADAFGLAAVPLFAGCVFVAGALAAAIDALI
jgi:predicted MFS family arabinose efflux permease